MPKRCGSQWDPAALYKQVNALFEEMNAGNRRLLSPGT